MELAGIVEKIWNIGRAKVLTPQQYFSKVKKILEEGDYSVSEYGLIMDRKDNYEDSLGDVRFSERTIVISPSKPNRGREVSKLADFLGTEKIPFRYKHY